jgi:hypothetical protein
MCTVSRAQKRVNEPSRQNRRARRAAQRSTPPIAPPRPPDSHTILLPFTIDWRASLGHTSRLQLTVLQAIHDAAQQVGRCGDNRCCSLCTAEPAQLYTPQATGTEPRVAWRFCATCRRDEAHRFGVEFEVLPEQDADEVTR